MLSGVQVMSSIDRAVQQALDEASAIDREIAELTDRIVRLRGEEGQACRELALFRLSHATDAGVVTQLSAAEDRARALLAKRSESTKAVDARIAEVEQQRAALAGEEAAAASEVDARRTQLAGVEDAALARLAETEPYRQQRQLAEDADRIARRAEEKTQFVETDRIEKGKPYESDPLFMYLWSRGYGTSEYRAGPIARFFDRRVAALIGYDEARRNYAMLLDIPRRLQEHAERCRQTASNEAKRLEELEQQVLQGAETEAERQHLAQAESALAEARTRVEAAEKASHDLLTERAALTGGDDPETRAALAEIVAALQRADLQVLREEARRTPLPDDDRIVERIGGIEADLAQADKALKQQKIQQLAQRKRLEELEKLRADYRRNDYGGLQWQFGDPRMLTILLTQMLGGALSRDGFWEQMRHRRGPGGFGGDMGGGFGGGLGGGMGGGFNFPRRGNRGPWSSSGSGRSGGDGFTTGGSF